MLRGDKTGWVWSTYFGAIDLDKDTLSPTLPTHLAECLRRVHAGHVTVEGNRITYYRKDIIRIGSRWEILGPFGSGELEVDSATRQVRYRLSVARMIIGSIVLFGFVGVLLLCASFPKIGIALFLPGAWIGVIGGNLLIGIPRFRTFLRRSISTAPMTSADG